MAGTLRISFRLEVGAYSPGMMMAMLKKMKKVM
jgi:hypothetical protein